MNKFTFIDYPKFIPLEEYDNAIDMMVQKMKNIPGVISICQVGGINDPGISDIDLVVIFEKSSKLFQDPRSGLNKKMKYLFSHNLFGMPLDLFDRSKEFSFFTNFKNIWGKKLEFPSSLFSKDALLLKNQIAIEYIIKFFVTLTVQLTYGIVKLRPLLLETKALELDLEILNKKKSKLSTHVKSVHIIRKNWFGTNSNPEFLKEWLLSLYAELELLIKDLFENMGYKYYLEKGDRFLSSKNVVMRRGKSIGFHHKGTVLPGGIFAKLGKKRYFNLNNRFNNFEFFLPLADMRGSNVFEERAELNSLCLEYNRVNIPYFSPLISGVPLKKMD